jgi:CrcB protein
MGRSEGGLLAVVAAGGALGSAGRWALSLALPHAPGGFPWSTLAVNVSGSAAMGALVVWVLAMERPHPWLRPFLGVGILGGWTTYSAYMLDALDLLAAGRTLAAAAYVLGSLAAGLAAVGLGVAAGEQAFGRRP